ALVLMLAAAMPAAAQPQGQRIEVHGVIVATDARQQAFLLREDRQRADRLWVIHVQADTRFKIEGRRDDDDDDKDLGGRDFVPRAIHALHVGSRVEVRGRIIAANRIVANEIRLVSQVRAPVQPPFFIINPPAAPPQFPIFGQPQPPFFGFPQQPQVFYPQNGAVITSSEFTIIGRTFPFAQVHVDVATVWAFFTFGSGSADVMADGNGFFAATVRPSLRLPGATYRITVTSQVSGVQMPPTTITVTQQ
ncbi:MAG: hypothetical protein ACRDF5_09420, partial [bacterium]